MPWPRDEAVGEKGKSCAFAFANTAELKPSGVENLRETNVELKE